MDDLLLLRRLALLMGWEETQNERELTTTDKTRFYVDPDGDVFVGIAQLASIHDGERWYYRSWSSWNPLHAIGDAWQVIQRLQALGWHYELASCFGDTTEHYALFMYGTCTDGEFEQEHAARAATPERAICDAALKVLDSGAALRTQEGEGSKHG